jgi:hypothetical protein
MLVPEAAANLDDFLARGKNQIRLPWEFWGVKPVAVAHAVDETAYK